MAEACQRATTATDHMHTQWSTLKKSNEELSDRLQQMEEKMKEINDHMEKYDFAGIPHIPGKQLWDQLQATKMEVE